MNKTIIWLIGIIFIIFLSSNSFADDSSNPQDYIGYANFTDTINIAQGISGFTDQAGECTSVDGKLQLDTTDTCYATHYNGTAVITTEFLINGTTTPTIRVDIGGSVYADRVMRLVIGHGSPLSFKYDNDGTSTNTSITYFPDNVYLNKIEVNRTSSTWNWTITNYTSGDKLYSSGFLAFLSGSIYKNNFSIGGGTGINWIDNWSVYNGTSRPQTSIADTTKPTFSNIINLSTNFKRFDNVTYNFTITDETALDFAWIESNHTGTLQNLSFFDISGTSYNYNANFNISVKNGDVIGWRACGNDSSNNIACSSINLFTIQNTAPSVTFVSPTANKVFNSGTNINFTTTYFDLDGTTGNCILYINNTVYNNNASSINNTNIVLRNNVTLNQGTWNWYMNCSDGTATSKSATTLFRVDNQSAVFTWTNPSNANTTKTRASSILLDIGIVDNFVIDSVLARMFNSTSTIYNNLTSNVNSSSFTVNNSYPLTGLPDGTYYIEVSANDTASFSPKIPTYTANKKTESIDFVDSNSGVNITLTIELHNPAGNKISMAGKNLVLNATKDAAGEHITFGGSLDNLASGQEIKFKYHSNNNLPIKWIKASQFPAHLLVGNKFFHHKDLITKGWNITQTGFEGNDFFLYFSKSSYNSTEDFDPITGEITLQTEVSSFVYDTTAPNISLNNPVASASLSTSLVDFNFTITDANTISNCSVYHNGSGTFTLNKTLSSITNNTLTNISITLSDSVYLWGIECEDEVGNINKSSNRTFTLTGDTTLPKVNISLPINNSVETLDDGYDAIINFYYNVTDASSIQNCTLYINGIVEASNTSVVKGANSSFGNIHKQTGSYNWSVKCWDSSNNLQTSETFLFSVPSVSAATNIGGGSGGGGGVAPKTIVEQLNITNGTLSNTTSNYNISITETGFIEKDKKDLKQIINDLKDRIKNSSKEQIVGGIIILSGLGLAFHNKF